MAESALIAFLVGGLLGVLGTVMIIGARALLRGSRDIGTDVDRATTTTLHLASRAAKHLRGEVSTTDAQRALRALRELVGVRCLAMTTEAGVSAVDGGNAEEQQVALAAAVAALGASKPQVVRRRNTREAVTAPVRVADRTVGALAAVDREVRATTVRATTEAAEWVAAQLQLGELAASRAALAEAQVRALRAQISPHFIYNALGAIASFITTDPARARDLVLEFADFTRYSFRREGDTTTLAEELQSIDSYLKLERARFGERLTVLLMVAPEVLPTPIPFLSLQPLVENAVRHGLEAREAGGRVRISARDAGPFVEIDVEDDGVGMDPVALQAAFNGEPSSAHVGLRNVDTRLRQRYGNEFGLTIDTNVGSGMLVRMRIPKTRGESPA
ncbi:MAG TPA: sensor histidine kinase [Microbacteriaceae bacterium]|nr:sensor histidine kinase [Microbacteriaceae bacterium]